ncbi:MAG: oligosaccharide flippase family protein [Oscillospiraceae bacterium]|jgi:stage V sporulation protein B|nr:oligosaccharide flippase family protein [Oscillospiraceae bacterium]
MLNKNAPPRLGTDSRRLRALLKNTALLTATSLFMRAIGMVFEVWLTRRIGASGIGLFQLVMSVSALAATVAISGIRFAATRLVAMQLGKESGRGVYFAMKKCLIYSVVCGSAAGALLFFFAPAIGTRAIGDARTVLSLRILALSLPCFSLSSVIQGYFTAVTRVLKQSVVAIIEQFIRIAVIFAALTNAASHDLEYACAIIVFGGVTGEIISFFLYYILYRFDRRQISSAKGSTEGVTREMFGIAVPLALSAYARTALTTLQHLLIPRGLKKFGQSSEGALASYGMISGMVFPVLMFPSALFYALAEMMVPELTDAETRGDYTKIKKLIKKTLLYCFVFSVIIMTAIMACSEFLGKSVYKTPDVARLIRQIAWLVPIMYLDGVTDGMLRGLGLQVYAMGVNIADSVISLVLVWWLLPRFGISGYVFMIFFTEIFNFILSIGKLYFVVKRLNKTKSAGYTKSIKGGAAAADI